MKRLAAGALVFFFLVYRPLYPVKKDTKLILDEIQKLSTTISGLEKKVTIIAADISELNKKVEIMTDKVNAVSANQADRTQNKETSQVFMQNIKEELNAVKASLTKIYDRLTASPPSQGGNAPPSGGAPPGGQGESALNQDPSSIYYAAYSDYIKENYDLAIEGFKQYIKFFPEGGLADNSMYWIGECYYAKKKYQDAIATFNELITKYKDGDKVPAAILKKGYALVETGKQSEGVTALKELISRFPLSEEASLAQQKLKEIAE